MANYDIDLTPPLTDEAKKYLTSRGQDWKIPEIEAAYENQQRSLQAAEDENGVVDPEDDYKNWKVNELKAELSTRRELAREELGGDGTEEQFGAIDRRFSTEGNKPDLIRRLEEDDAQQVG